MEFYGFLHFAVNTFTDKEWGYGDEDPETVDLTEFDANQFVGAAAWGGMKGLVLMCKHHDGFRLWPSRFTEHCGRKSPWRTGHNDVVRKVSEACAAHGLKFGVCPSHWGCNPPGKGRNACILYYRNPLRELLTGYGSLLETWFDGANGGDGYYGGARNERGIDRRTYDDWDATWQIVRDVQPGACIFSDAGPDIRWVGSESGIAGGPCWHTINRDLFTPGDANKAILNSDQRSGTDRAPTQSDLPIRPGCFCHATESDKVRSPENLPDLCFQLVGRGDQAMHRQTNRLRVP